MQLKTLLIVLIIPVAFQLHILGQDSITESDDSFVKTFENEFKNKDPKSKEKPIIISIGSEILPNWFFNPPPATETEIYSIGIADPAVPEDIAKIQATERALSLVGLMSGTQVSALTDNYQGNNGGKFEEMTKYKGTYPIFGNYSVIDSFTTRFKEKIILLKYQKSKTDSLKIKAEFELYKSQRDANVGTYYISNIIARCKRDTNFIYYKYEQYVNNFQIISIFNKQPIDVPLAMYDYTEGLKNTTDSTQKNNIKLPHRGLWQGYIESFMENLSFLSSNIKS